MQVRAFKNILNRQADFDIAGTKEGIKANKVIYSVIGIRELHNVLENVKNNPKSTKAWGEFYAKVKLYQEEGNKGTDFLKTKLSSGDFQLLQQALGKGMTLFQEYGAIGGEQAHHPEVGSVGIVTSGDTGATWANEMMQVCQKLKTAIESGEQ